jgi:hypothetical protein
MTTVEKFYDLSKQECQIAFELGKTSRNHDDSLDCLNPYNPMSETWFAFIDGYASARPGPVSIAIQLKE